MRYADTSLEAAITAIRSYPERYRQALKDRTGAILRQRPGPHTWSALEYTCHVRDVYSVYTDRLARTLAQERPILEPMRNEQRAARGDYNNQDPRDVLDALTEQVAQFASRAESVTPAQLSRTATRLPGEERTVLWLVRQASHEGLHHLRDIERILVSLAGAES